MDFTEKLDDVGITRILSEELTLRDVVQAMRFIRSRMFTPVPNSGFTSTRTSELLNYRASVPPIVTTGHLNAVLDSPTRVEREIVELVSKGILRKFRVERRGGIGHALIEASDLETMVKKANLSPETEKLFLRFLREDPSAQTVPKRLLSVSQADELVRAGFLISAMQARPESTLHVRPEDRTTLTSIQHVSQFASGTVSAVGGRNAIHLSGGGGGKGRSDHQDAFGYRLAVPGHGRYLKLAEEAVDWLREALAKTKWGEGPEVWLRERFTGGELYGTRWKDFWGVEWEWLLGEAVGLGIVEAFDTSSVGKGIRATGR